MHNAESINDHAKLTGFDGCGPQATLICCRSGLVAESSSTSRLSYPLPFIVRPVRGIPQRNGSHFRQIICGLVNSQLRSISCRSGPLPNALRPSGQAALQSPSITGQGTCMVIPYQGFARCLRAGCERDLYGRKSVITSVPDGLQVKVRLSSSPEEIPEWTTGLEHDYTNAPGPRC